MHLSISSNLALVLLTMSLAACGGGASDETAAPGAPAGQTAAPAPTAGPGDATAAGQIAGFVFDDKNRNGTFDGNESRIAELTVVLADPSGTQQLRSTTTGTDGSFRLDKLTMGEYRIQLEIPGGFERTSDDSFVLAVNADGTAREVQFGIARQEP